jgi:hypothetical protein
MLFLNKLLAPLDRIKTMFQAGPGHGEPPHGGIIQVSYVY